MSHFQGGRGVLSPSLARLPRLSPPLWLAALALAAVAASLPGLWTLSGLAGLAGVILILARPQVAAYLLTLSVPLGSLLEVELGKLSVTPTEGLVALMAIGWLARAMARRRMVVPMTPLTIPLAAVLSVVAISGYQAAELSLTLKEALKWLELILVFLFAVAEMRSAGQAILLLALLVTGAAIEALIGFAQFSLGMGPETFAIGRFMRAYGTFEQPNPYAGYLGMLIPLAIGLLLARPGPRLRSYLLASALLAATAVGVSLSRGAWVGIALAIAAMMLFWSHRSRIVLVAGSITITVLLALAFLNILPPEVTARVATAADYFRFIDARQEVVTSQNWAVVERVAHWQAALDMIRDHPLLGVGAGNYPLAYERYFLPGWLDPLGHAHNYYLNMAAETGVPGLLVYLVLLATALLHTMRWLITSSHIVSREGEGLHWRGILAGVLGTLVASSVHNMFDNLFVHSMSVQLGMILALGQLSAHALSQEIQVRKHVGAVGGTMPACTGRAD